VKLTPELIHRIKLETLERLQPCLCPEVYDPDSDSSSLLAFIPSPPPVDDSPVYCEDCGRRKIRRPRLVPTDEWPPKQV
jgi:hypothetical protein